MALTAHLHVVIDPESQQQLRDMSVETGRTQGAIVREGILLVIAKNQESKAA